MIRTLALLTALASPGAVHAANLAATPASFAAVVAQAHGGDTIRLTSGLYSGLAPKGWAFSPAVTITSADPSHPATLTNFEMHDVKGVTFRDVEMRATAPGYFVFQIFNSSDVHFDRVNVHGSLDGDPTNDAEGIRFSQASDISVTNSEFHELKRALAIGDSTKVTVAGNRAHDLQVTGLMFGGGTTHVSITGNAVWNIRPVTGDHPDAIQFLTAGSTAPATDIVISRNVVFRGSGKATQGIFLRDQVGSLPYERVTIGDNLIVGTGYNGILVMGAKDLTITDNRLISNPGDVNNTWMRVETAEGVKASGNTAQMISFVSSSRVVERANRQSKPVADGGAAALRAWAAAHPEMAPAIAEMTRP